MEQKYAANSTHKPIFILGSGRSGTSILTGAIRSGAKIEGYLEGHFLPLILSFMQDTEHYYYSKRSLLTDNRHMIADVSQQYVEQSILNFFRQTCESLATNPIWLDKSPDSAMIKTAPYLLNIWSESRFIFAKRRGIENIISRLKKFPHVSFEDHCIMWKDCMESWLRVKDRLQHCAIEIEQRDIALNPKLTANRIGDFLHLEPEKTAKIAEIFITQRPQSTGGQERKLALDINETNWSETEKSIYRQHCTPVSHQFGYSETSAYYL